MKPADVFLMAACLVLGFVLGVAVSKNMDMDPYQERYIRYQAHMSCMKHGGTCHMTVEDFIDYHRIKGEFQ